MIDDFENSGSATFQHCKKKKKTIFVDLNRIN